MNPIALLFLLVASACLSGCRDDDVKTSPGEAAQKDEAGIGFKPKAGLSVPADVARHIGLQLGDVTERKVNREFAFTAQVYGNAGPQARRVMLASAWVDLALAPAILAGTDIVALTSGTNSLAGVVTRIVPAASTNSPAEVLLELRTDADTLNVGDFVRVTVTLAGTQAVTAVPRAALLRTTEGDFVYVVNGPHLIRAGVKVGGEQDGFVEIKSGLLTGDKIAVAGVSVLRFAELHHVNGGDACCVAR